MKEATGELTNVIVVATSIAILVTFFYFVIWPVIQSYFRRSISCEKAVCNSASVGSDGMMNCIVRINGISHNIECKYKG